VNYTAQLKEEGHLLNRPAPRGKAPRKRIRKVSKKRGAQLKKYAEIRKRLLVAHPYCQVWATLFPNRPLALTPRSSELHHVRGRIGDALTDERYLLAVCRESHDYLHAHPSEARRLGFIL